MSKRALIILADGFEEIEAVTCIDVLRRCGIKVTVAGLDKLIIKGAHGVYIHTEIRLRDYKKLPHALILPGGLPGATNLAGSRRVNLLIQECFSKRKIVAAICASPAFVLAYTGILKKRKSTCYPGCQTRFAKDIRYLDRPVVIDGNVITSQGPGTAIYFALAIARSLAGEETAGLVRKRLLVQ
jgi:4-methyl-5(b-hydroxyethyl)-thiazole monophosphate biosynthesis